MSHHARLYLPLLSLMFFVGLLSARAPADEKASANEPTTETVQIRVRVINGEGEPIAGATIRPSGMRTKIERGSHYGWAEDHHGKRPEATSDESGEAVITCPKFVYERMELGEVTWLVDHEDYIVFREDRSVDDDPAEIELKRGRRIAVTAVDADTKTKVTDNVYALLSGGNGLNDWNQLDKGMLLSRGVDTKRTRLMVFHLPDDAAAKFSKVIDLSDQGKRMRVLMRDIELQNGTRVEGKIDDNVPRPITNGTVSVSIVDGGENDAWDARLDWNDWTKINDDGTFVFESLPRGGVLQMIAVCDGWVSSDPSTDDLKNVGMEGNVSNLSDSRIIPQVVSLNGNAISCTIAMEATASCRIKVLSPDGNPVPEARVHMWPNQIWLNGGSQIVGAGFSQTAMLRHRDDMKDVSWTQETMKLYAKLGIISDASQRYLAETNAEGIAEIHTLHAGLAKNPRTEDIHVDHDDFEQPVGGDRGLRRESSVELVRGETAEITIRMNPKGTTLIGE